MKARQMRGRAAVGMILLLIAFLIRGCEFYPRMLEEIIADDELLCDRCEKIAIRYLPKCEEYEADETDAHGHRK